MLPVQAAGLLSSFTAGANRSDSWFLIAWLHLFLFVFFQEKTSESNCHGGDRQLQKTMIVNSGGALVELSSWGWWSQNPSIPCFRYIDNVVRIILEQDRWECGRKIILSILEFVESEEPYNAVYTSGARRDHSSENEQNGRTSAFMYNLIDSFFFFFFLFCLISERIVGWRRKKNECGESFNCIFKILSQFVGAIRCLCS